VSANPGPTTFIEQGKIWFPKKPWRDERDAELVQFPHGKHDEETDVLAYGALQISNRHRRQSFAGWDRTTGFHIRSVAGHYHGGSPNVSVSQPNRRLGLAANVRRR